MRRRLLVFFVLTGGFVVLWAGWELVRDRSHADERAAWRAVTDTLSVQQARIDSFEAVLGRMDEELGRSKRALAAHSERLRMFERSAPGGTLPTPQHREYLAAIEEHNRETERHNLLLAETQSLYARYSDLIDMRNALADSANAMQRRAVQEGYSLPPAILP